MHGNTQQRGAAAPRRSPESAAAAGHGHGHTNHALSKNGQGKTEESMEQSESLRVGAGQPSGGGGPCVTCLRDTPSSARDIRRGRELETSDLRAQGEAGPSGPRYFCGLGWQKNVLRFWPNSERNPRFSYVAQRKKLLYKEWKKRLATPTGFQFLDGPARAKQSCGAPVETLPGSG